MCVQDRSNASSIIPAIAGGASLFGAKTTARQPRLPRYHHMPFPYAYQPFHEAQGPVVLSSRPLLNHSINPRTSKLLLVELTTRQPHHSPFPSPPDTHLPDLPCQLLSPSTRLPFYRNVPSVNSPPPPPYPTPNTRTPKLRPLIPNPPSTQGQRPQRALQ